jgi:hypothetical protein
MKPGEWFYRRVFGGFELWTIGEDNREYLCGLIYKETNADYIVEALNYETYVTNGQLTTK